MLRIVCCYVPRQLREDTRYMLLSITQFMRGVVVTFIPLDPNDDRAYGHELEQAWADCLRDEWALAIVEPDIIVTPTVIAEFIHNEADYLCFPYEWLTNVGPALGCTRFSAAFIQRYPNLMREAVTYNVGWQQLDIVIMRRLLAQKYGEQPQVLLPPVTHLNPRKKLRPDADPTPLMSVPTFDLGNLAVIE